MKKNYTIPFLIATLSTFGLCNAVIAKKIAGGTNHSLVLCDDGTVNAWGKNSDSTLGLEWTMELRLENKYLYSHLQYEFVLVNDCFIRN